jgi:hypothetical protein
LLIATQNHNDSLVSGSAENAPENYTAIQLDFDFTLTKKTIASTLLVFYVEVEVIFKVDFFDDILSP